MKIPRRKKNEEFDLETMLAETGLHVAADEALEEREVKKEGTRQKKEGTRQKRVEKKAASTEAKKQSIEKRDAAIQEEADALQDEDFFATNFMARSIQNIVRRFLAHADVIVWDTDKEGDEAPEMISVPLRSARETFDDTSMYFWEQSPLGMQRMLFTVMGMLLPGLLAYQAYTLYPASIIFGFAIVAIVGIIVWTYSPPIIAAMRYRPLFIVRKDGKPITSTDRERMTEFHDFYNLLWGKINHRLSEEFEKRLDAKMQEADEFELPRPRARALVMQEMSESEIQDRIKAKIADVHLVPSGDEEGKGEGEEKPLALSPEQARVWVMRELEDEVIEAAVESHQLTREKAADMVEIEFREELGAVGIRMLEKVERIAKQQIDFPGYDPQVFRGMEPKLNYQVAFGIPDSERDKKPISPLWYIFGSVGLFILGVMFITSQSGAALPGS